MDWRRPFGRRRVAAPEIKDSRTGPLIALTGAGRARWTPRDYAHLADEGFGKNAVAYRCVRMIAEAAASTPLMVMVGGVRTADHPLARLIDKPNPEQSSGELMEGLYGALQTAGNAYVEATGDADGDGAPDELWALRPDRMKVVPGRAGWPEAYEYAVGGRSVRIARHGDGWSPVMHLKLFHPTDDHYGFSPLEAAAFAIDVHNASGARNAGRPLLLEGGLDWKPMSLTPHDMDFIAGKHAAAREIALAFGVPPQLLGIPGDATYANYREANAAFWRGTVIPLVRKAAGAMTGWLDGRFVDCRIEPDLDAVPALQVERDALWARLNAASFLTDEERRRMAGVGE